MISANVVAASQCIIDNPRSGRKADSKILSMEVTMPRSILAEFNTHRMFSRNSASSRAIPARKMIKSVEENPFMPMAWGKEHSGMQATEYYSFEESRELERDWAEERQFLIDTARRRVEKGVSKQIANRRLEADMWHKVLVTSTEWDNFFELRCPQYDIAGTLYKSKKDVYKMYKPVSQGGTSGILELNDPNWLTLNKGMSEIHMMALAEAMYDAYQEAEFKTIEQGEYHIPYGDNINDMLLLEAMYPGEGKTPADVIKADLIAGRVAVAIARCARLSYQTLGEEPKIDYVADLDLYRRLVQSGHMSPSEHVARAMDEREYWSYGKTIMYDKRPKQLFGYLNNFQGFIQQRILIENIYE